LCFFLPPASLCFLNPIPPLRRSQHLNLLFFANPHRRKAHFLPAVRWAGAASLRDCLRCLPASLGTGTFSSTPNRPRFLVGLLDRIAGSDIPFLLFFPNPFPRIDADLLKRMTFPFFPLLCARNRDVGLFSSGGDLFDPQIPSPPLLHQTLEALAISSSHSRRCSHHLSPVDLVEIAAGLYRAYLRLRSRCGSFFSLYTTS